MNKKNDDLSEIRCPFCGCFMGVENRSTESGYDWVYVCNNPRCKTNQKNFVLEIDSLGFTDNFDNKFD